MSDRLAALLCDLFPTAERSRWPFSVQLAAEHLRAAGVTVAPPAAPTYGNPEAFDHAESCPIWGSVGPCNCKSDPAAPLDVERLARALGNLLAGNSALPEDLDVEWDFGWIGRGDETPRNAARLIAAAYDALATPAPKEADR